jgi:hypothetical protein
MLRPEERAAFPVWVEVVGADVAELVGARLSGGLAVGREVAATALTSQLRLLLAEHLGATAFRR